VKKNTEPPVDLPGQVFFEFAEQAAPPPPVSAPTPRVRPAAKVTPPSAAAPVPIELPAELVNAKTPPKEVKGAFVTESRASEIFVSLAAQMRPGQVSKSRVVFKPFRSTLYSFKITRNGTAQVKFHQAFRQASETVLHQAMQLMLARRKSERKFVNREAYDEFVRALPLSDFALPGARKPRRVASTGPGKHRSLDDSFERVNATYFSGRLEKPELCWSPVRARRVLGSYQERYDRLIISKVFDTPQVPEFVLDYLMFHELLHKFLGIGRRNDGKRCMHGAEFRSIEKQFKRFDEATAFLKKL